MSVDLGGPDLAPFAAPHADAPQAQTSGGPVMANPKFLAISFDGDLDQAMIDAFVTQLAPSNYWANAVKEYGVGAATVLTPIHIATAPTASQTQDGVAMWLKDQIMNTAGFPAPDDNTIYTIFYPANVQISGPFGFSCATFNGYHDDFQLASGQYVTYAVVPRCPPPVQGLTSFDMLTATGSHEFIEAATDPVASDNPAWDHVDDAHAAWAMVGGGGEIGDLCAGFPGVFYQPADLPFLVQRVWSNAAAAAGHDPCQPGGVSPYFNSAAVVSDDVEVAIPFAVLSKGVKIPVGSSAMVELDLFSDAPTSGPWTVKAIDFASTFMGQPTELKFAFDKTQGQNGDKIQMTITAAKAASMGASPFWIQSDLGNTSTVWLGVVGQ